jgi:hypothetical protein
MNRMNVIPAEAGIQGFHPRAPEQMREPWIPACAGMTRTAGMTQS